MRSIPRRAHGLWCMARRCARQRVRSATASADLDAVLEGLDRVCFHDGPARLGLHHHQFAKDLALSSFGRGFVLVLIMHRLGIVNLPVEATSFAATSARLEMIFAHSDFFISHWVARASPC